MLHFFVTSSICLNFVCVAMVTFVTVWGSGKALRGQARGAALSPNRPRLAAISLGHGRLRGSRVQLWHAVV